MKKWLAWILTLALLPAAACAGPAEQDGGNEGVQIYFLAPADEAQGSDRIRAQREILDLPEDAGLQRQAEAVVARLLEGPPEGDLHSPFPQGVELLHVELRDQMARVDLSEEFREMSGVELVLADYCLTLSLTALDGIRAVSVTAMGRPVGQQPKQLFYEWDVLLSDMGDVLQTVEVSLSFPNASGAMAVERRTISLYEGQTLAETLIAALLEGPESRELVRVIPEGFAVNYVRVESGVCYVSLPAASLAALPGDMETQRLILWSLADSLYSLDAIEEIRLLADGEELAYFGSVPVEEIAVRPKG